MTTAVALEPARAPRHVKTTTSVCPRCLVKVPATVFERDGAVLLEKRCPEHGHEEVLLSSDAALYWHDERGSGACGPSGCALGALGHSCTLIFEITERCNLTCPTCFTASSPHETWSMTLEDFARKLDTQIAAGRKDADIVQLSGGEPTIHPDIERMIELTFARGIRRVYVNTNGVRLAKDREFAARLGELRKRHDLQLYLQFDGNRDETSSLIRGKRGLSEVKRRAIENALTHGIYVLPVMTVTRGVNETEIGDVVLDDDRYAAAEASLGWLNGRAVVAADRTFEPAPVLQRFLEALQALPIAHLKLAALRPARGAAAIVRRGGEARIELGALPASTHELAIVVNARVALPPAELEARVRSALAEAAQHASHRWEELACFEPGRPVPVHRYTYRCGSGDDASCCAAFYDRPDVRYLLGESFHPGGTALTLALGRELGLTEGARVLDVACGHGTSLRAVTDALPVTGVGLDSGAQASSDHRLTIVRGCERAGRPSPLRLAGSLLKREEEYLAHRHTLLASCASHATLTTCVALAAGLGELRKCTIPPVRSPSSLFGVGVVLGLVLVAATQACSSGGSGATNTSTSDGGASPSVASDAVLRGRWERLFSGLDFDFPNVDPWLDARDGRAHFVYRSKTGVLRYFVFDAQGTRTEVTFPQGTKLVGRVAVLPSGESVVTGIEPFSAQVSSFRRAAGATEAEVAPPLDPARGRIPLSFESVAFGGEAVVAGVAATGDNTVAVDRLGSAGWESLGDFPQSEGVSRVRLTSQGESLALAIYTGTSARSVRRYERGAWRELEGLPPTNGPVGVPSLVIDGDRVFLLEYQQSSSTAVVWVHDGKAWSEFARSDPAEGLRALVLHQGALYALYGEVPNQGLPVTFGIARVDRARITRSPFDAHSAQANIDPDSRHDVMSQEACQLVSSGPDLFLSYMEGISDGTTLRLYKHVRR